ncbi:MAG: hypothetical protein JWP81_724 [Ferruginibacter sp.]|nr:hypothetical protein [Ferruginibacter sp.]
MLLLSKPWKKHPGCLPVQFRRPLQNLLVAKRAGFVAGFWKSIPLLKCITNLVP